MNVTISNTGRCVTVHKTGCRDLAREGYETRWTLDVQTLQDVVLNVYPPTDFEYDKTGDAWKDYLGDIHAKPCVVLRGR